jgi:hypothetical protein
LILNNVHLLYALIHDYEDLVQLFLHPCLAHVFPYEEGATVASGALSNGEADLEATGVGGVHFSLPHGLVVLAKHYLDSLDVLSEDSVLFSAAQVYLIRSRMRVCNLFLRRR